MAQVYFHCSNNQRVLMDRCGSEVAGLIEAHEHAARVVRSLISTPTSEDWRNWAVRVSDDLGDEIFVVPFASVLGKPN